MAVTLLCSQTDVENIWSAFGVSVRADDRDTVGNAQHIAAMLEKSSADVQAYLLARYDAAVIAASTWCKWAAAIFCCVDMARRRGNAPPGPMFEEYTRYKTDLEAIRDGSLLLTTDTGLAPMSSDLAAVVSNFRVNSRYAQPVRRLPISSTESQPGYNRKRADQPGNYGYAILYW